MPTGNVELTILDGGAGVVSVPQQSVFVVISTCSGGTAATVVATRNPNTLATAVGYGPGVDAAAMIIAAGGTVLFMKAATTTAGVASAVVATGAGTSLVTVTGAPYDAYLVKVVCTAAGTIGTTGIRIKISLDAGRSYGPEISLGTAVTYAITGTNLVLNFAAGTFLLGSTHTFGCSEPLAAVAGIQACLVALAASPYAVTGWGGMLIQGVWSGANATSIAGYLTTLETGDDFTRAIIAARDAALPTAYGGAGETDAVWAAAIALDYSAVSAARICANGGYYNMTSQYPVAAAGAPIMRRPLAFALACRQVAIPAQRLASRVADGALKQIVVDPTNDPTDGFIYHDESNAPSLDVARFCAARTRKRNPGYFISNPFLMAASGSVFNLLPKGVVMDIGCTLLNQLATQNINDDIPLNTNGTIAETAAQNIETIIANAMNEAMLNTGMLSAPGVVVTVDRSNNVRTSEVVNIAATLYGKGYIREIRATIGYAS
jgi:hypothetical protein